MMPKVVGFVLSPKGTTYVPLINPSLVRTTLSGKWGMLTLYATGEGVKPVSPGVYSLGFPPHAGLLDHNLLITIREDEVIIENDWLGGIPVYYNPGNRVVSTFPSECLPVDAELDDEGLYLFLRYGFSAFGTTPFKEVFTLRYFSMLRVTQAGFSVNEKPDPVMGADISGGADEQEIWERLRKKIVHVLDATTGLVVSPQSGGLDSRIINALVPAEQKHRIRTYSYGSSTIQHDSFESVIGSRVAARLGLKWKHIPLEQAFRYIPEWHDLFGFATHLHGMFHIEFFKKILADLHHSQPAFMFSGISGSAFQGGYPAEGIIKEPRELYKLALTHHLDCNGLLPYRETQAESRFFAQNQPLMNNLKWYPVVTMRIKMNVLHYLFKVPASLGIPSATPYHDFEIVTKMLALPGERRKSRIWVEDFFKKNDLHFPGRSKFGDTRNTLNRQLFVNHVFEPLDAVCLQQPFIKRSRIEKINYTLGKFNTPLQKLRFFLTTQRVIKEILKKMGVENVFYRRFFSYLTLKALEKTLKKQK